MEESAPNVTQPLPSLCLQAGNNLLIVQSPGQPAVVQQVQVVQPKADSQVVQIPQQALKVVQAASATLPPVPQRQPVPSSLQVTQTEPTPTQVSVLRSLAQIKMADATSLPPTVLKGGQNVLDAHGAILTPYVWFS